MRYLDEVVMENSHDYFRQIYPKEGDFIVLSSDDWRVFENSTWREMTVDEQMLVSKYG